MATSIEEKHIQLVNELEVLNSKLNKFINGSSIETVQLDSGVIKTLSGVEDSLQKFKYVQKVINHRLYSDMIAQDVNIEDGLLVRIWGDTDLINGLYLKTDPLTYNKISYQDIYDLRDVLPNPWNYVSIIKDKTEFNTKIDILSFKLPSSSVSVNDIEIKGSLKITSDTSSYKGSHRKDFIVHIVSGSTSMQNIIYDNVSNLSLDSGFDNLTKPSIQISVSNDGLYDIYTISIDALKDLSLNYISSDLEVKLLGLDTKLIKVL